MWKSHQINVNVHRNHVPESISHLTFTSLTYLTDLTMSRVSEQHESPAARRPVTYEDIINQSLESEEAFRTYLSSENSNVRRAYKAFKRLLEVFDEAIEERDQLTPEVATLKEELKEQQHASFRMEGALTYVEINSPPSERLHLLLLHLRLRLLFLLPRLQMLSRMLFQWLLQLLFQFSRLRLLPRRPLCCLAHLPDRRDPR